MALQSKGQTLKFINKPQYKDQGPTAITGREVINFFIHKCLPVICIIPKESSDIRKSRLCSVQSVRQLRSKGCKSPNIQKGQSSGPCRLCGGLEKVCLVVPTALLVRVQCSRNFKSLHMVVEGMSTRHIVTLMIPGSYCRRRGRFTIFVPEAS